MIEKTKTKPKPKPKPKTKEKKKPKGYIDKEELTKQIVLLQLNKKLTDIYSNIESIKDGTMIPNIKKEIELIESKRKKSDNIKKKNKTDLKILNLNNDIKRFKKPGIIDELMEEAESYKEQGATLDFSKEIFGEMVLSIINNLLKKHCFSGYTENWTEDFKSNAIYKIFKYIHNFDSNMISKVTGYKVSSFAYLTQITYMSFLEVIKKRKKENDQMFKTMIPLSEVQVDYHTQDRENNQSYLLDEDEPDSKVFTPDISELSGEYGLLTYMKKLRLDNNRVTVNYPEEYKSSDLSSDTKNMVSINEYEQILNLRFDMLNLIKFSEEQNELKNFDEESSCFNIIDEDDESWEWEEIVE